MKLELDQKTLEYIEKLEKAGGKCYIVGGYVRDKLLGIDSKDIDIEVYNLDFEQLKVIFKDVAKIQGNFGVFQLFDTDTEFAIPRIENKIGKKHQDFSINMDPFLEISQAANRRDFTINSLMYDCKEGKIIDNFSGISDLNNKIIRHVSNKFEEDALRVIRGVRFSFKLGFKIDLKTQEICRSMLDELRLVSSARKNQEFIKMFKADHYEVGLEAFAQIMLPYWNLTELISLEQNEIYHPEGTVWEHIRQGLLFLKSKEAELDASMFLNLCYAYLLHDIGKLKTKSVTESGKITFYGHDKASAEMAKVILDDCMINKKQKHLVLNLIEDHMIIHQIGELRTNTVINLFEKYKDDFEQLLYLKMIDEVSRMKVYNQEEANDNFERLVREFYQPCKELFQTYLDLKIKYNGNYFIERGIMGEKIKEKQRDKLIKKLKKIRKAYNKYE